MTTFTPQQVQAFRYWIQGYQNFCEPLVAECLRCMGYAVTRPATVPKAELDLLAHDVEELRLRRRHALGEGGCGAAGDEGQQGEA